jgi:hypothetical protein
MEEKEGKRKQAHLAHDAASWVAVRVVVVVGKIKKQIERSIV